MRSSPLARVLIASGILAVAAGVATYALVPRHLPRDQAHPVMYVALGDSTVQGVGATSPETNYVGQIYERLRSVYPRARLTNLGVSGAAAPDVLSAQLARAVALGPDLVTLSIGPNDITGGRNAQQYEQDLETILSTLANRTAAVVVVNLIPDLTLTPRFRGKEIAPAVGRRVVAFNEALTRQARAHGAELVDLYTRSREELPRYPQLIAADGYHPSDQGYARWAELMWQGVLARIRR